MDVEARVKPDAGTAGSTTIPLRSEADRRDAESRDTGRYPRFMEMLSPEDRQFLLARSVTRCLAKHQALYVQGDPSESLFIILRGTVKVHYIQDNGTSLTTSYCREGMLVGAHGCTRWAGSHSWSAQALVDSKVLWISREQLVELSERSPHTLRCVLAISEFKGEQLKKVIRILAEPTVERRIGMALRHLGSLYGIERRGEVEIDGRFTHQEIAEMIGASRQSVTMMLLNLEKAGEIRREGRRLFIRAERAPHHPQASRAFDARPHRAAAERALRFA